MLIPIFELFNSQIIPNQRRLATIKTVFSRNQAFLTNRLSTTILFGTSVFCIQTDDTFEITKVIIIASVAGINRDLFHSERIGKDNRVKYFNQFVKARFQIGFNMFIAVNCYHCHLTPTKTLAFCLFQKYPIFLTNLLQQHLIQLNVFGQVSPTNLVSKQHGIKPRLRLISFFLKISLLAIAELFLKEIPHILFRNYFDKLKVQTNILLNQTDLNYINICFKQKALLHLLKALFEILSIFYFYYSPFDIKTLNFKVFIKNIKKAKFTCSKVIRQPQQIICSNQSHLFQLINAQNYGKTCKSIVSNLIGFVSNHHAWRIHPTFCLQPKVSDWINCSAEKSLDWLSLLRLNFVLSELVRQMLRLYFNFFLREVGKVYPADVVWRQSHYFFFSLEQIILFQFKTLKQIIKEIYFQRPESLQTTLQEIYIKLSLIIHRHVAALLQFKVFIASLHESLHCISQIFFFDFVSK